MRTLSIMRTLHLLLFGFLGILVFISCSTDPDPIYNLTTSVSPSEAGSVTPANAEVSDGETVEISATPNQNWVFERWEGDYSGSDNPASFIVDSDKNVTAIFLKREFPLTINTEGNGTVTERVVQAKSTDYPHGSIVELTANPAQGWEFVRWSGDLESEESIIEVEIDGDKTLTAEFDLMDDSDPTVRVNVNWEEVDGMVSTSKVNLSHSDESMTVTDFGIRLVYTKENAVFIQSVSRSTAENEGLITLEVPPTEEAFLFATAVNTEGKNEALLFGTLDSLKIERGTIYDWSIDDFEWVRPEWIIVDSLASDYENGLITADKDESSLTLTVHVTDPFFEFLNRQSTNVTYEESILKLSGSGNIAQGVENGFRDFRFHLSNPNVGVESTQSYEDIFPFLESQKFNFPSVRYVIKEKLSVDVRWE